MRKNTINLPKKFFLLFVPLLLATTLWASPGDTTIIQTFSFSEGRVQHLDSFNFPDASVQYEKILMLYTLKCDNSLYPACGEWDYIFTTDILKPVGFNTTDSTVIYDVWKLGTYITPYGYGIDLGEQGWTWVYDVTDYVHLLQGKVILRDGNYQELLDLKFLFIEGRPPRDVLEIRKVWDGDYSLQAFDSIVTDTTLTLLPNTKQLKLLTTVTGHGFGSGAKNCAEFCHNMHAVKVNGFTLHRWDIMQDCVDNPLYPQGGTWIYARAGWCPGMKGTTNEFDLTEYIDNSTINIDYDVESDPYGTYRTFIYLVSYGDINQSDDVAAERIVAPTVDPLQYRYNPTCGAPIVVIKNIGSNTLKTVDIDYSINNGTVYTYKWKGNLVFLEEATVTLNIPDYNDMTGDTGIFQFTLSNPNGQTDPTAYNNKLVSVFKRAVIIPRDSFEFAFHTNHAPIETTWMLYNMKGEVLYQNQQSMSANTDYITQIKLPNGSYKLCLYDSGEDGLYWPFYDPAYGGNGTAGSAVLRYKITSISSKTVHTFNPNFGRFAQVYFAVNQFAPAAIKESSIRDITIYPNPTQSAVFIDLSNVEGKNLAVEFYDMVGRRVLSMPVTPLEVNRISVADLSSGVYMVFVNENGVRIAKNKILKQ